MFTRNFVTLLHTRTHNFVTHNLSHTTLSSIIFHTQSCAHNFVTHILSHTTLPWYFSRQAWHLVTRRGACGTGVDLVTRLGSLGRRVRRATFRGSCGGLATCPFILGLQARTCGNGGGDAPCFAWSLGALQYFAWQAWRSPTSNFVLRGRRGTWWHPLSFCVASAALIGTGVDVVMRLGSLVRWGRRGTLRGSRGAWRHPPSFCVGMRSTW